MTISVDVPRLTISAADLQGAFRQIKKLFEGASHIQCSRCDSINALPLDL
jgi:LSD1 subclass zinc finger protein